MSTEPREELAGDLKAVELALRQLVPTGGAVDRDRLMYLAGRASAKLPAPIGQVGWPLATAALAIISVTLASMLWSADRSGVHLAQSESRAATGTESIAINSVQGRNGNGRSESNYFQLRSAVFTRGVDALPPSRAVAGHGPSHQPALTWPGLRSGQSGD